MISAIGGEALLLGAAAFLTSAALAGLIRRYALRHALLDLPNERSAHSAPTPRGGGLAVVLVVLLAVAALAGGGRLSPAVATALGGGGVVAVAGWLDDRRGLPAPVRLAAHAAAAAWALYWLGGLPSLTLGTGTADLGRAGWLVGTLAIVWGINLYNFMDGIDGLAGGVAVTVGLISAGLLIERAPALALVALLASAAAAGFLVWNWPPARLFLGDVGSGFLGFLFATLAVASERSRALPAVLWLLLLGPFVADATLTLLRRMWRGDRWYAAHRSHAYQRATQAGWSHRRVTTAVLGVNLAAAALAALAARQPTLLPAALAGGGAMLATLYAVVERWRPMPPPDRRGPPAGGTESARRAAPRASQAP